jgi:hypothetical protein
MAKVTAHPKARKTTSGAGNSSSNPVSFNTARATSANAMPTRAHTIQDGKYEPRMFLEGAPSQPAISPDKQIHGMSLEAFMAPSLVAESLKKTPPFGGRARWLKLQR